MSRAHQYLSRLAKMTPTILALCLFPSTGWSQGNCGPGGNCGPVVSGGPALVGCAECGTMGCAPFHAKCCAPTKYFYEGPPRIWYKKACPRPICDPCHLPHYGYFRTCWHKWPWPPNWSHCPCPPPGAKVPASTGRPPVLPEPGENDGGNKEDNKNNKLKEEEAPKPRPIIGSKAPRPLPIGPKTVAVTPTRGAQEASSITTTQSKRPVQVIGQRTVILNVLPDVLGPIVPGKTRVELWYTKDAKKWHRDEMIAEQGPPFEVEMQSDGTYGFTVRAMNEVGRKQLPPRSGDAPQIWVEVDTRAPEVKILGLVSMNSQYGQMLRIRWRAADRNLSAKPIGLAWARDPLGPWTAMTSHLENTGEATVEAPQGMTSIYVRVEAHDLAGNVGKAQTQVPVKLSTVSAASTR